MSRMVFTASRVRSTLLTCALAPLFLAMSGCLSSSSSSSSPNPGDGNLTGTFVDSPVAGLDYQGSSTPAGQTNENGQFTYVEGENISFAIGDLELGSAPGAEVVTPLSVTEGAESAADQRVTNKLILLQTLDADGDLNNGIQITEVIRAEVSTRANSIYFDQAPGDFRASLEPLLNDLQAAGAFSDTDPRARQVTSVADARDHFARSMSPRKVVTTTGGQLRGFEANDNTWQFLGVPYAKPPLGDLRWKPPVAPEPWSGVRDAVAWADQSAQDPSLQPVNKGGMSEDSLYLNVTTPKDAEGLPVMVWFHGGSFTILSGNSEQYNNPDSLTNEDVVLVTVNHRLGPFGYIAHPLLSAESGYNGSGNYGQMDLVKALEWVRDNIAEFGGDPSNVTLFGQSGGGGKTYALMNSPLAKGLFHKAIVQSAFSPLDTTGTREASLSAAEQFGAGLFQRAGVTSLEEARALDWTELVQADIDGGVVRQSYRPNVDYYYLPNTYYQNAVEGMPSDVPLMAGVTSGDGANHRLSMPVWLTQRTPTYESDQFVYKFSRVPDGWADMGLRSCHGCELPYLFNHPQGMVQNFQLGLVTTPSGEQPIIGDLNGNGITGSQGDREDIFLSMEYGPVDDSVAEKMMKMWANFARTGNPSTESFDWPVFTLENDTFIEIEPDGEAVVKTGLDAAVRN